MLCPIELQAQDPPTHRLTHWFHDSVSLGNTLLTRMGQLLSGANGGSRTHKIKALDLARMPVPSRSL